MTDRSPAADRTARERDAHRARTRPVDGDSGREGRGSRARQRLLTQAEPSHAAGIADAVVIKDGAIFFLNRPDGSVPMEAGHGLGLYLHDCRFLSGYEMSIADVHPEPLATRTDEGFRATSQLTNPNISRVGAGIDRHRIGITWTHAIDAERQALRDRISIANYDTEAHEFPLTLAMRCDFSDVYVIRGLVDQQPGRRNSPRWEDETLVFSYDGGDDRRRELAVEFSERPDFRGENSVRFDLRIEPHETRQIDLTLSIREFASGNVPAPLAGVSNEAFDRSLEDWMHGFAQVRSSSRLLAMTVHRSLQDLRALRMDLEGHRFFAAGIPWFATLFGRDSLTCALQTLAYRREIAAETLRLLASLQGRKEDSWRDEEPGKILHELRVGELARMGRIPYTPYYGTVDATPLFLIVLAEYTNWVGDLGLFEELREPAEAALRWIDDYGDHDGDGYLDYQAETGARLINQGWKDAGGSIIDSDGRVADAPIALVEVQGYVYHAKLLMAGLFERIGDQSRADTLREDARRLRERFNRDFWMDEEDFFAIALERGGRQVGSISSNPGHAIWTGIIDPDRLEAVVSRLMSDDMFSGWGVRTLSAKERGYNPVGYHLGTVWPHDNAFIAVGLRNAGFNDEACRIFTGMLSAARHFDLNRLPELFAGYGDGEFQVPVRYPVACHPQAWAAGSVPHMLQAMLGLRPDAFERRLRVIDPTLPPGIERVELTGVRCGAGEVDLRFDRGGDGRVGVEVERVTGDLEVSLEDDGGHLEVAPPGTSDRRR